MKTKQIIKQIESENLPLRIFGTGEVTHILIGKIIKGDGSSFESVCLIAEPYRPASTDFQTLLNSEGCQCGKQKTKGFPLCGLCFSNLRTGIKAALRSKKAGELETTYNFAVKSLREVKR